MHHCSTCSTISTET